MVKIYIDNAMTQKLEYFECESSSTSIANIKKRYEYLIKGDPGMNLLITHNGQILQDDKTLEQYGIQDYSTLYLNKVEKDLGSKIETISKLPQGWNSLEEMQNIFREESSASAYCTSTFDLRSKCLNVNFDKSPIPSIQGFFLTNNAKFLIIGFYEQQTIKIHIFNFKTMNLYHEFSYHKHGECKNFVFAVSKNNKYLFLLDLRRSDDQSSIVMLDLETKTAFPDFLEFKEPHSLLGITSDSKSLVLQVFRDENGLRWNDIWFVNIETKKIEMKIPQAFMYNQEYKGDDEIIYFLDLGDTWFAANSQTLKHFCSDELIHDFAKSPKNLIKESISAIGITERPDHYFDFGILVAIADAKCSKITFLEYRLNDEPVLLWVLDYWEIGIYHSLQFSSDNAFLIAKKKRGIFNDEDFKPIHIFEVKKKARVMELDKNEGHDCLTFVTYDSESSHLVTISERYFVRTYGFFGKKEENWKDEPSISLALSKDDKYIFSIQTDGTMKVFELKSLEMVYHLKHENLEPGQTETIEATQSPKQETLRKFEAIVISSDDQFIYLSSTKKKIFRISFENRMNFKSKMAVEEIIPDTKGVVLSMLLSSDNKYISCQLKDQTNLIDLSTLTVVYQINSSNCVFSNDNNYFIYCDFLYDEKIFKYRRFIKFWDLRAGRLDDSRKILIMPCSELRDIIKSLVISHDDQYLSVASLSEMFVFATSSKQFVCFSNYGNDETNRLNLMFSKNKRLLYVQNLSSFMVFDFFLGKCIYEEIRDYSFPDDLNILKSSLLTSDEKWIVFHCESDQINQIIVTKCPFYSSIRNLYVHPVDPELFLDGDSQIEPGNSNIIFKLPCMEYNIVNRKLYYGPHGWTILHLLVIFQSEYLILVVTNPDFKVPFLVDNYGKTPLHYLLSSKKIEFAAVTAVTKFILKFLNDGAASPYEKQLVLDSLTDLFPFLISRLNPSLTLEYLKQLYIPSVEENEWQVPAFGKKIQNYMFDTVPTVRLEILPKIYKEGRDEVSFKTLQLKWDYNIASDDMLNCAKTILKIENEILFNSPAISRLIDHLWNSAKPTLTIFGVFFLVLVTLISVYIGIGERILALEIIIIILTGFAFITEFLQVSVFKIDYFKEIWNWIDLSQHFLVCAFMITRFTDDENELTRGWLVATIIIVCYSRLLSYLRLFSASRNLIQIILSILKGMWEFLVIMFSITIGFSLIFLEFGREENNLYLDYLYGAYQIWYGNFDDSEYSPSQKILAAMILFILYVVLLNMLIAIMGDTYGKVQEARVLTDSSTRLKMCLEAMSYLRIFKRNSQTKKGYLLFCGPAEEDEESESEWEERMNTLKKLLKEHEDVYTKEVENLKKGQEALEQNVHNMSEELKKLRVHFDKSFESLRQGLTEMSMVVADEGKPNLAVIKNE